MGRAPAARVGNPGPAREAPVLFYADGEGWRAAADWPPPGVAAPERCSSPATVWIPELPPAPSRRRGYRADPTVGTAGGLWDPFGTGHGWPEEQSGDDAKSLTFTSKPLRGEPLLIAGRPRGWTCTWRCRPGTEAHLVARLSMVEPDDRATLITAGWLP